MNNDWADTTALAAWAPRPQQQPAPQLPPRRNAIFTQAERDYWATDEAKAVAHAWRDHPHPFTTHTPQPIDELALARYRATIEAKWDAIEPRHTHQRNAA
jgi:hypothetical protein